jgi:cell division septation protein DedD
MTVTTRRAALPRHEFRVGRRELVVFAGATVLVWTLTFVFGILVGRELNGGRSGVASVPARPASPAPGEPVSAAASAKKEEPSGGAGSEERLTFYKTLTAPTLEVPPPVPPRIEERIVPHDAPPGPATRLAPPAAEAPARPAPPPRPVVAPRTPPAARAEPAAKPAPAAPAPLAPAPPALKVAAEPLREDLSGRAWTVQVSSFRSRALADELRGRLAAKGFDAYLVSLTTEDGRVRHRVRVGGFATRVEAERVAGELRGERDLNPFVTTRAR